MWISVCVLIGSAILYAGDSTDWQSHSLVEVPDAMSPCPPSVSVLALNHSPAGPGRPHTHTSPHLTHNTESSAIRIRKTMPPHRPPDTPL
mmetsp:Transcript_50764/g.127358  ORF Transcript_50764/g.127358 Transcript_50764/m.127358 type:complete len:90 (-) Transcript_50764:2220-2489(-)